MDNSKLSKLLESYDKTKLTIASLGGHSALEVCLGAKKQGLKTCVVAKKGREKTYQQYLKTDENTSTGCVDEVIVVDEFSDILKPEIQQKIKSDECAFCAFSLFLGLFQRFLQSRKRV